MLRWASKLEGLTGEELEKAAQALRFDLKAPIEKHMKFAKERMVVMASGSVIRRRSGRTARALARGKVSSEVFADRVEGRIVDRALILNILEGGAHMPAVLIRPKFDESPVMRFFTPSGQIVFVRGEVLIPARTIAPRPIRKPALEAIVPGLIIDLERQVEATILEQRGVKT